MTENIDMGVMVLETRKAAGVLPRAPAAALCPAFPRRRSRSTFEDWASDNGIERSAQGIKIAGTLILPVSCANTLRANEALDDVVVSQPA